jgi:hypothetical protein
MIIIYLVAIKPLYLKQSVEMTYFYIVKFAVGKILDIKSRLNSLNYYSRLYLRLVTLRNHASTSKLSEDIKYSLILHVHNILHTLLCMKWTVKEVSML